MQILLLNGERSSNHPLQGFASAIEDTIKSTSNGIESITLHEKKITNCRGCFGCWTKTPGLCVIEDEHREIVEKYINSDLAIFLTPIIFGGYSYQLKRCLDRLLCLYSPLFATINGEVHHRARYDKYPSILGIGITADYKQDQVSLFRHLVKRNGINLLAAKFTSEVWLSSESEDKVQERIYRLLKRLGDTS